MAEAHGELGVALHAVKNEPEKATEHVARALKHHKAKSGQLEDASNEVADMKDRHQDVGDSHEAMARTWRTMAIALFCSRARLPSRGRCAVE